MLLGGIEAVVEFESVFNDGKWVLGETSVAGRQEIPARWNEIVESDAVREFELPAGKSRPPSTGFHRPERPGFDAVGKPRLP